MLELETSANGVGALVEAVAAAAPGDQGGVAELGFGAGGRVALEGVRDPELVAQAKPLDVHRRVQGEDPGQGRCVHAVGRGRRAAAGRGGCTRRI